MSLSSRFRRRVLGVLAAAVLAGGLSAATAGPAQAQSTVTVVPGGTVVLRAQGGITPCTGPASSSGVRFLSGVAAYTAPTTAAVGTTVSVVLRWTVASEPSACTVSNYSVEIVAEKPNAVRATFTPVPPPGPCLLVSATSVDFGDVQQGGPWVTLTNPPLYSTCSSIQQRVVASASQVYVPGAAGTPVLTHASCTVANASCVPGTDQLALGHDLVANAQIIPQAPASVSLATVAGASGPYVLDLALKLGTRITTTAPVLAFDIALTAVAA